MIGLSTSGLDQGQEVLGTIVGLETTIDQFGQDQGRFAEILDDLLFETPRLRANNIRGDLSHGSVILRIAGRRQRRTSQ